MTLGGPPFASGREKRTVTAGDLRSSRPRISAVVTTCADSPALRSCVERLLDQAAVLHAEVLVAFNVAETDVAGSTAADLSGLGARVLFEPRPGKSNALNAAVAQARGSAVAFTDDDALPDEGWLEAITAPLLAEDDDVAGSGGPVLPVFPPGGPPDWFRELLARTRSTFLGPYHFLGNEPLEYAETDFGAGLPFGASCAFRRDALLQHPYHPALGPNRATGLLGGEDTALALELLREGGRLRYVPAARVHHPVLPQRMTRAWVEHRHRVLGRETVELKRALGEDVHEPETLRDHIRTCEGRGLRRLLRHPRHQYRRYLRRRMLEGMLEEVQRS